MSTSIAWLPTNGTNPHCEPILSQGPSRKPFQCPICYGVGKVSAGFYSRVGVDSWTSSTTEPEKCRSCDGKGIVWSPW